MPNYIDVRTYGPKSLKCPKPTQKVYQIGYHPDNSLSLGDKISRSLQKHLPTIPNDAYIYYDACKKYFGIKEFNMKSDKAARFILNAFIQYENMACKKIPKIDVVTNFPSSFEQERACLSFNSDNGVNTLYFDEKYYTQPDENINDINFGAIRKILSYPNVDLSRYQRDLLQTVLNCPEKTTKAQKDIIKQLFFHIHDISTNINDYYLGVVNNPRSHEIMNEQNQTLYSISEFEKLDPNSKNRYVDYITQLGCKSSVQNKTEYSQIFSILGMLEQRNKIGKEAQDCLFASCLEQGYEKSVWDIPSTSIFAQNESNHRYTSYISTQAMKAPGVFVAEKYAGELEGSHYCQEINDMYKKYQGPSFSLRRRLSDFFKK